VDHGGSSWKVFTVFSRRNLPPPAMSMHLCTPLRYMESNYLNLSHHNREKRRKQGKGNFLYVRYCDPDYS